MRFVTKFFLIGALVVLLTGIIPNQTLHAQIFSGTDSEGTPFGICLEEAAKTEETHPNYEACKDVNCAEPEGEEEIVKCTTEAEAGTDLVGDSLSGTGVTHTEDFSDFIKKVVNFSLPYLTLAAFVGYVVAGFMYVTALGDEDQIGKAKKILIWSTIGLILVILSYSIVQFFTEDLVEGLNEEG